MKQMTAQELYNETIEHILRYLDPTRFTEYRSQIRQDQRNDFNRSTKGARATQSTKDRFEELLKQYLIDITNAHNCFTSNNGQRSWNEGTQRWSISIGSASAKNEFKRLSDKAYNSKKVLYNFERENSDRTQDVMLENELRADRRNEAIKDGAKRAGGVAMLVGGAALATAAALGIGNAIAKSNDGSKNTDRASSNTPKVIHHEKVEHAPDYGAAQHGWVMDGGAAVRQHLKQGKTKTVTFVETEDLHETEEEFTAPQQPAVEEVIEEVHVQTPPPQRVVKKVVRTPDPVTPESIEYIQDQVQQHTVAYQTAMQPATRVIQTVTPAPVQQVIQPVAPSVDNSQLLNNLTDLGIAAINGHAQIKTARYMSRKGPDVLNVTNIDDHSVRGSYNDNSSRSYRGGDRTLVTGNGNDYSNRSRHTLVTNNGNTDNRLAGGINGSYNRQSTRTSTQTITSTRTQQSSVSISGSSGRPQRSRGGRNCDVSGQLEHGSRRGAAPSVNQGRTSTSRLRSSTPRSNDSTPRVQTAPTRRVTPGATAAWTGSSRPTSTNRVLQRQSNAGARNAGASFRTAPSNNTARRGSGSPMRRGR